MASPLKTRVSVHHQLIANLSLVQRQCLEESGNFDNISNARLFEDRLYRNMHFPGESNLDDDIKQARERERAILLTSAASQGNSGVLSIIPPTSGPRPPISNDIMPTSDGDRAIRNFMPEEMAHKSVAGQSTSESAKQKQSYLATEPSNAMAQVRNANDTEAFPGRAMIARMRTWRQGAIVQHLHQTAVFWGDKIFSWTGEPDDAFWLAQAYFLMADYRRAELILLSPLPTSPVCRTSKTSGNPAVVGCDFPATQPFDDNPSLPKTVVQRHGEIAGVSGFYSGTKAGVWGAMAPSLTESDDQHGSLTIVDKHGCLPTGSIVDWSMPCRYLAALSLLHQERLTDALALVGESNPFAATGRNHGNIRSETGDLKLEASMCRLRGILYLRMDSLHLAKESYMESLALDVRNFDVFLELTNSFMTPEEEWHFIHSLAFNEQLQPDDAYFVRTIYTARLHSNPRMREISEARKSLAHRFNLEGNLDLRVASAQNFFVEMQWEKCHDLTSSILQEIPNHRETLPLHLACLTQLPRLASSLFMLAHRLVRDDPLSAISWYAIGLWYFTGHRWVDARRYFAATHEQDARFCPAWICFAHCFAYEGEHEQAITAYSTTARIFPGTHLPYLCIGMEYMQLNNLTMAQDALNTAYAMCESDPTLLNEMGVLRYYQHEYYIAVQLFTKALQLASSLAASQTIWADIYCNLGHCERRRRNTVAAKTWYLRAVKYNALSPSPYTGLGMIAEIAGNLDQSIERYHQALALSPQDAVTTVLLESVLSRQEALAKFEVQASLVAFSAVLPI